MRLVAALVAACLPLLALSEEPQPPPAPAPNPVEPAASSAPVQSPAPSHRPKGFGLELALRIAAFTGYWGEARPDHPLRGYGPTAGTVTFDLGARHERLVVTGYLDVGLHDGPGDTASSMGSVGVRFALELGASDAWIPWVAVAGGREMIQESHSLHSGKRVGDWSARGFVGHAEAGIDYARSTLMVFGLFASAGFGHMGTLVPHDAVGKALSSFDVESWFRTLTVGGRVRF